MNDSCMQLQVRDEYQLFPNLLTKEIKIEKIVDHLKPELNDGLPFKSFEKSNDSIEQDFIKTDPDFEFQINDDLTEDNNFVDKTLSVNVVSFPTYKHELKFTATGKQHFINLTREQQTLQVEPDSLLTEEDCQPLHQLSSEFHLGENHVPVVLVKNKTPPQMPSNHVEITKSTNMYLPDFQFTLAHHELFDTPEKLHTHYTDVLCKYFNQHNKSCVLKINKSRLNLKLRNRNSKAFIAYATCTFDNCLRYKFEIKNLFATLLLCEIFFLGLKIDHSSDKEKRRKIRGNERKKLAKELESSSCITKYHELMTKANETSLKFGNFNGVLKPNALSKIAAEGKKQCRVSHSIPDKLCKFDENYISLLNCVSGNPT